MHPFSHGAFCSGLRDANITFQPAQTSTLVLAYQEKLVKAVKSSGDNAKNTENWSFSGAFLYSLTVITTIGKSSVHPSGKRKSVLFLKYKFGGNFFSDSFRKN